MIRKQQDITKEVDGELTTIGTVYMKKHRIVVEIGGYKFKTERMIDKRALQHLYNDILEYLTPDSPYGECVLFFRDKNHGFNMIRAVISPNLVVTSADLGWEDDTYTIQDLYTYYKESSEHELI